MPKIKPAIKKEFRRGMVGLSFLHWGDKNHTADGKPICDVTYRGGNPLPNQTELCLRFPWRWKIRLMAKYSQDVEIVEIVTGQAFWLREMDQCLEPHKQALITSRSTLPDAFGWQATIIGG